MLVVDQCFYGQYIIYAPVRDVRSLFIHICIEYIATRNKRIGGKRAFQLTEVLVDKSYDNNIYLFTLQNNRDDLQ